MKLILALAGLLLLGHVANLLLVANVFQELVPGYDGKCRKIEGRTLTGTEDIAIDHEKQIAFLSSARRLPENDPNLPNGAISLLDLKVEPPTPALLTDGPDDFHPHGISLLIRPRQPDLLFVVNHRMRTGRGDAIEIFRHDEPRLTLLKTIELGDTDSANDVLAIDEDRFYVTIDHGARSALGKAAEDLSKFGRGWIGYYDGRALKPVATGFSFPNGIALSPDGKLVYFSAMLEKKIYVHERDAASGALRLVRAISVGTGADKIDVAADGALWLGAHPKLWQLSAARAKPGTPSPAQALRLEARSDGSSSLTQVYLNLGDEIAHASVAATHGHLMLLGSIYDDHILLWPA